tara:strand:+ start:226 stop:411 length:186 start_codon:yes stop_codon:yes gene_type:complete
MDKKSKNTTDTTTKKMGKKELIVLLLEMKKNDNDWLSVWNYNRLMRGWSVQALNLEIDRLS